ncbi:MAG: hypothetical protein IJ904_02680 [Candidatus Methanomethylophilaceae archaeon]|nr:hypothetical protein [Candidatus Methanomethylophilaceae archaeon]
MRPIQSESASVARTSTPLASGIRPVTGSGWVSQSEESASVRLENRTPEGMQDVRPDASLTHRQVSPTMQ